MTTLAGVRPGLDRRVAATSAERLVAGALVGLTTLRISAPMGTTLGGLAGLATSPLWLPAAKLYRDAVTVLALSATSLLLGAWLTWQHEATHATSTENLVANSFLLVVIVSVAGSIWWARTMLSLRAIGILAGLGMLATAIAQSGLSGANPWKTHLAVPVSIILLSVFHQRRKSIEVAALLGLAVVNAGLDSRSAFATCLLAAFLVAAQAVWSRGGGSIRQRALSISLAIGAAASALYMIGTHLLFAGYLGEEARDRSLMQQELAGSVIVGGRPEMAATAALMANHPFGFGAGTMLNLQDLLVAKSGMRSINYEPDNGYVENYMFGQTIKLHSIVGDLWAYFGVAGAALALFIAFAVARGLVVQLASGAAAGVTVFIVCTALWNIPFGPLYTAAPFVGLALGLALVRRERPVSPATGPSRNEEHVG